MSEIKDLAYPTPELIACPYPLFKDLQQTAPYVHRTVRGEYLIARPEDVIHVAMHPEIFSNMLGPVTPGMAERYRVPPEKINDPTIPTLWPTPFADGEDHDLKRSLLQSCVRPDKLAEYEPMIRRVVNEIIDGVIEAGRCEFKNDLARKIPAKVMLDVIGVPREDATELAALLAGGGTGAGGQGIRHASKAERAVDDDGVEAVRKYFRDLMNERFQNPKGDFLSTLLQEKMARDGRLDLEILITEVVLLYGASFGNTVDMMTQALYDLITHPETMARVEAEPKLIPKVIEESLRAEAPVQWVGRRVLEDTELAGVKIPKESFCLVMYGAANRDQSRFEDPDTFNIDRPKLNTHMAWGYGMHRCLGIPLARQEGKICFEEMFKRLTNIRLAPDFKEERNLASSAHRDLLRLNIEFDVK
jgi:cytochrome P450